MADLGFVKGNEGLWKIVGQDDVDWLVEYPADRGGWFLDDPEAVGLPLSYNKTVLWMDKEDYERIFKALEGVYD